MAGNRMKSREGFRAQESRTLANLHKIIGGRTKPEGETFPGDYAILTLQKLFGAVGGVISEVFKWGMEWVLVGTAV